MPDLQSFIAQLLQPERFRFVGRHAALQPELISGLHQKAVAALNAARAAVNDPEARLAAACGVLRCWALSVLRRHGYELELPANTVDREAVEAACVAASLDEEETQLASGLFEPNPASRTTAPGLPGDATRALNLAARLLRGNLIVVDPGVMWGQATFIATRVPVAMVL